MQFRRLRKHSMRNVHKLLDQRCELVNCRQISFLRNETLFFLPAFLRFSFRLMEKEKFEVWRENHLFWIHRRKIGFGRFLRTFKRWKVQNNKFSLFNSKFNFPSFHLFFGVRSLFHDFWGFRFSVVCWKWSEVFGFWRKFCVFFPSFSF